MPGFKSGHAFLIRKLKNVLKEETAQKLLLHWPLSGDTPFFFSLRGFEWQKEGMKTAFPNPVLQA